MQQNIKYVDVVNRRLKESDDGDMAMTYTGVSQYVVGKLFRFKCPLFSIFFWSPATPGSGCDSDLL